ncbi:hypothetical protein [Mycolicibacterium sp. YH-1]|uniref:hypothetical protein n=1 Tax=Mycolicibacterium sp. YH-1 TaxID=2908837 RepID=UPI001F4C4254|nr:hypothetical protein [Mycolicibacterium sp. YH-1]UNB51750.1 hypothetical protein L0M16_28265 [Mycolicibacterium sp. YH-1]HET7740202.1 hypothetical protein [Mycobacterium sp.]
MPEHAVGEPTGNWTPLFDTDAIAAQSAEAQPITATEPPGDTPSEPIPAFAPPEVVPGTYTYVKRWTFVLVVAGVWIVGAGIGVALYEWWFSSVDKTAPVFVVFVYVVVCTVVSLLIAMIVNKPLLAALAVALMSAPLASTAAAGVLYGAYVFDWFGR